MSNGKWVTSKFSSKLFLKGSDGSPGDKTGCTIPEGLHPPPPPQPLQLSGRWPNWVSLLERAPREFVSLSLLFLITLFLRERSNK